MKLSIKFSLAGEEVWIGRKGYNHWIVSDKERTSDPGAVVLEHRGPFGTVEKLNQLKRKKEKGNFAQ